MFLIPVASLTVQRGAFDAGPAPLLMRNPTVNKTTIVFQFAGDLWSVPRDGGTAMRLTSEPGQEVNPRFSPDGTEIAFSGQFDGSNAVYVMPAEGGVPKRLTYVPGLVQGWSPDGKSVIFQTSFMSNSDYTKLFTVPVTGGRPTPLPFPTGSQASFSPDGKKLAYVPKFQWEDAWKRYRGGQTFPIWIGDMSDSRIKLIPRNNSNDKNPMWVGDRIYFVSDRTGPFGLYSYDTQSGSVREEIKGEGFDIKSASAGPDAIVYEKFGSINLFDLKTRTSKQVPISIHADFPEVRAEIKNLTHWIQNVDISPSGQRAVIEARGHIFTVPAAKGDIRDITTNQAVEQRYPEWSPDGKTICFLTDASGEYQLVLHDTATDAEKSVPLGDAPSYYYQPVWSPDSKALAYTDNRHNLWILDVASGKNTKVDTATYEDPTRQETASWSPDSKWITFSRDLDNHLNAVFLYNLGTGKKTQITDGLSNARYPVFDRGGKYLYFAASTNTGRSAAWLDLSNYENLNVVSSVYAVVLGKDTPDPLQPESDEETVKPDKPADKPAADKSNKPGDSSDKKTDPPKGFHIDLEGIGQRIVALPMSEHAYNSLTPGPEGAVFAMFTTPVSRPSDQPSVSLIKFDLTSRSASPFSQGVTAFSVDANGDKAIIGHGATFSIVPTASAPSPGQGELNLGGLVAKIDPRKEWRELYHEVLRDERDFFYDPHHHGVNLVELERRYQPFLENLCSRNDLDYLFTDMLGELCIGHMFISAGDEPSVPRVPMGYLGADYSIENGRYRFARVFNGESWNPQLRAPLTQPGVSATTGEYLLAVDGRDLKGSDDIYERLEGKAGKQVRLKIGSNPDGTGARDVVAIPVGSEFSLRALAWEEDNRRTVDKLSGGKIGYAHIPDTNVGGWANFNRYYYSQIDKAGMVIDERFNHGGEVDDYMVESMLRPMSSMWTSRYGKDFASPASANFGPKVLITNELAGSGGDYFPWHFKHAGVGPIVGKRTWGGLVGILVFPVLLDSGYVTAPNIAFYNPNGTWDVENHGVDPDVDVEFDPYLWRQGHDAQLEKAVEVALDQLRTHAAPTYKKPNYLDKTTLAGATSRG